MCSGRSDGYSWPPLKHVLPTLLYVCQTKSTAYPTCEMGYVIARPGKLLQVSNVSVARLTTYPSKLLGRAA